ncbi:hypothetical protein PV327_003533 [Microctonus hyperodae]|uniref:Uncharacterized protein n=1 Tax=Microctonus hyperodae TaxID=165561 RepID=A0AA39G552_MICHY|nr:hypothetical protein PV327_003533 [Microctonus hyperodae]
MVVGHDGQCEHFGRVVKPIREVNVAWVHRSFSVKCRFCRYPMGWVAKGNKEDEGKEMKALDVLRFLTPFPWSKKRLTAGTKRTKLGLATLSGNDRDLSFGGPHIPRLSEVSHKRMVSNNYSSSVVYADMPPDPPGAGERSE